MTAAFHPLRRLRETLQQIGTAVNASREYSVSQITRAEQDGRCNQAAAAIPL